MRYTWTVLITIMALALSGDSAPATSRPTTHSPHNSLRPSPPRCNSHCQSASASWYGPGLFGNYMACGGRLTTRTIGVAHKTLPCGTRLTICYGRRCEAAQVVDRGPFVAGREFDLTSALAASLGFSGVRTIRWVRA